jgi:hypothetical protein
VRDLVLHDLQQPTSDAAPQTIRMLAALLSLQQKRAPQRRALSNLMAIAAKNARRFGARF